MRAFGGCVEACPLSNSCHCAQLPPFAQLQSQALRRRLTQSTVEVFHIPEDVQRWNSAHCAGLGALPCHLRQQWRRRQGVAAAAAAAAGGTRQCLAAATIAGGGAFIVYPVSKGVTVRIVRQIGPCRAILGSSGGGGGMKWWAAAAAGAAAVAAGAARAPIGAGTCSFCAISFYFSPKAPR